MEQGGQNPPWQYIVHRDLRLPNSKSPRSFWSVKLTILSLPRSEYVRCVQGIPYGKNGGLWHVFDHSAKRPKTSSVPEFQQSVVAPCSCRSSAAAAVNTKTRRLITFGKETCTSHLQGKNGATTRVRQTGKTNSESHLVNTTPVC